MALRTRFAVLLHPVTFTYGNRRGGLGRQRPFGRLLLHDVAPRGIVESRKVPARLFEPGVVVLAAEDAVEGHGRKRIAPRGVRENAFAAAVGIGDIELHTERRRSVAVAEFHIAAAADVVHAVAQHDAQSVRTFGEQIRQVEGVVIDGLAVFAPKGFENGGVDLAAVDPEVVMPQSADAHDSLGDGLAARNSLRSIMLRLANVSTCSQRAAFSGDIPQVW